MSWLDFDDHLDQGFLALFDFIPHALSSGYQTWQTKDKQPTAEAAAVQVGELFAFGWMISSFFFFFQEFLLSLRQKKVDSPWKSVGGGGCFWNLGFWCILFSVIITHTIFLFIQSKYFFTATTVSKLNFLHKFSTLWFPGFVTTYLYCHSWRCSSSFCLLPHTYSLPIKVCHLCSGRLWLCFYSEAGCPWKWALSAWGELRYYCPFVLQHYPQTLRHITSSWQINLSCLTMCPSSLNAVLCRSLRF